MIKMCYRRLIKYLVKRGFSNIYIGFHVREAGYDGGMWVVFKLCNKYRKGGEIN